MHRSVKSLLLVACVLFSGFAIAGEDRPTGLPDGLNGFLGALQGKLVEKGERGFDIKVDKVVKTWEKNKASNPEVAIGKVIHFRLNREQKRIVEQLAALEVGTEVVAGGAHREGDALNAVEVLVKADEWAALQEKWAAAARERAAKTSKKAEGGDRVKQLEKRVSELEKENAALRKKLGDDKR